MTIGTRYEVFHNQAQRTAGGLTRNQLVKNKKGQIVSKKASSTARKSNNLGSYLQKKGRRSGRRKTKPSNQRKLDKMWSAPPKPKRRKKKT